MGARHHKPVYGALQEAGRHALSLLRGGGNRVATLFKETVHASWVDSLQRILLRLAFPPSFVAAMAIPAIAVMMSWVFLFGNEESPLSYAAYVASAYLLAVLCAWIARNSPRRALLTLAAKHPVSQRALDDIEYRRRFFVFAGLTVDALWAAASVVAGIYFVSVWLITLGAYYMLLCAMRGSLLHHMRQCGYDARETIRAEMICGVLLLLSTFVLSVIVYLVMQGKGTFVYSGVLIYAVAAFAFYSLTSAIVNYARLREHENMLVVLNCRVNLAVALVSIFALEVAMLAEFGTSTDADLSFIAPIITGAVIAIVLIILSVRSIIEANKVGKKIED